MLILKRFVKGLVISTLGWVAKVIKKITTDRKTIELKAKLNFKN